MAESVVIAHAAAPDRWGVTLFPHMIRLNVGRIEVLAFFPDMVHCIIDSRNVPAALQQHQDVALVLEPRGVLPSVPVSCACDFPAELASELFPMIRSTHDSLIRAASRGPLNPGARVAYSSGVTDFLASRAGLDLQHPSYHSRDDAGATPSPYFEGTPGQAFLSFYERNPVARERCIERYGCRCSVCGFDFEAVYGEIGRGFIHVHHLTPQAEIRMKYEIDPIADLRPICPNCHAMIHRGRETMTIDDLRELIQNHVGPA